MSRSFRDGFNIRLIADTFRNEVVATKNAERCPVNIIDKLCYAHLRHDNIYIVCCTGENMNCLMTFQYIIRLLQILFGYFHRIDELVLKEHFVTVQEILDETLDFGYPQQTEIDVLKSYITTLGIKSDVLRKAKDSSQITIKATGKIPWRKEGILYAENALYLDVIEDINLLLSQDGQVLQREVSGRIALKCYLSGMPECRMVLNDKMMLHKAQANQSDKVELDDVTFHSCVRLNDFQDSERSICFVPPDGQFVLLRYRSSGNVSAPLRLVNSRIREVSKTRMEIDFGLKSEFPLKSHAKDVVVKIPCPSNTANVKVRVSQGKAKFDASSGAILWKLKRVQGGAELFFSAEVSLISSTLRVNEKGWTRPPVSISFSACAFAASGIKVESIKVTEQKLNYETKKGLRYFTTAGQYQCRI